MRAKALTISFLTALALLMGGTATAQESINITVGETDANMVGEGGTGFTPIINVADKVDYIKINFDYYGSSSPLQVEDGNGNNIGQMTDGGPKTFNVKNVEQLVLNPDKTTFMDKNTFTASELNNQLESQIIQDARYLHYVTEYQELTDSKVKNESTNLITGDFALSATAGTYTALKGLSVAGAGLATWELGLRDWLFGSNDADAELWKSDIRSNAVQLEEQRQNILDSSQISEDALFGDAMAEARIKGVEAFNNNSTRTEAKNAVSDTVEDYYSDVERVVINGYNNEILRLENDLNNANKSGADFSSVFQSSFNGIVTVKTNYTLPNGEKIVTYNVYDDSGRMISSVENGDGVGLTTTSGSNYSSAQYLDGTAHYDTLQGIRSTRSNAITNVNSVIDNIYDNNQTGNIAISEEFSALELFEGLSTNYAETGSYNYASALLARSGQPTDLDSAFNISYDGQSYEGALFASNSVVNGTVEAGQTYDGSQGAVVFVAQGDTSAEFIDITGNFTVNSITSLDDGSSLNSTDLQQESAYTQNIVDLQSEINELEELYTTSSNGGAIGGGLFGGLGIEPAIIAGLVLVLAGAIFA